MGIFGKPQTPDDDSTDTESLFGERRELKGPLPIIDSLVATVEWLEKARNEVSNTDATCCLVVCAPNPIDGAAMELTMDEIASRFAHNLRSYDVIFRHGREKFLIALPHVKNSDAPAVLVRLKEIISRIPIRMPGGLDYSVTVSLGGVMMDSNPVQDLINRADKAMVAARISGNHTCMWSADLQ